MPLAPRDHTARRLWTLVLLAAGYLLLTGLLMGGGGPAPYRMTAAYPARDTTMAAAPRRLTLTFTGPVLADGSSVLVASRPAPIDQPDGSPESLVADLRTLGPLLHGQVPVTWRALGADGRTAEGQTSFWVGPRATPEHATGPSTYLHVAAATVLGTLLATLSAMALRRSRRYGSLPVGRHRT
jgi:methionine-rich copper-binding protein CopC